MCRPFSRFALFLQLSLVHRMHDHLRPKAWLSRGPGSRFRVLARFRLLIKFFLKSFTVKLQLLASMANLSIVARGKLLSAKVENFLSKGRELIPAISTQPFLIGIDQSFRERVFTRLFRR